jgi:hypothetical protein
VEDKVLHDEVEAARRLEEDDVVMSSQDEVINMEVTESSTDRTECDNIKIIVTDKTVHTPELGTTCVQLKETHISLSKEDNPRAGINNFLRVETTLTVQPRQKTTDMRKSTMFPGSPDLNMSPGW